MRELSRAGGISASCLSILRFPFRYWVKQNYIEKYKLSVFSIFSLMFPPRRRESLQWRDISMILFVGQYLSLEKIVRLSELPEQSSLESIYDIFLVILTKIFRMYATKRNQMEAWRLDMIQSMCRIRTHAPHDVKTCFRRKMQFPFWH